MESGNDLLGDPFDLGDFRLDLFWITSSYLAAKQHQGSMAISQQFYAGFSNIVDWYTTWPYMIELAFAVVGFVFALWRGRAWFFFWMWTVVYFVSYSVLEVSGYFWYYAPLVPGFLVAVGVGIEAVCHLPSAFSRLSIETSKQPSTLSDQQSEADNVNSRTQGKWLSGNQVANVLSLVLLGFLLIAQGSDVLTTRLKRDTRYVIYRAVGEWLNINTHLVIAWERWK
jgi:hypothetical protein